MSDKVARVDRKVGFKYESNGNKWLKRVQHQSESAIGILNVIAEVNVIRATLQEMQDRCRVGSDDDEIKIVKELRGLALDLDGRIEDAEIVKDIQTKLDKLVELYNNPLTEMTRTGPVRMSDSTRIGLVSKLAGTIASLATVQGRINMDNYVPKENVVIWMRQVYDITRRVFKPTPEQLSEFLNDISMIQDPKPGQRSSDAESN